MARKSTSLTLTRPILDVHCLTIEPITDLNEAIDWGKAIEAETRPANVMAMGIAFKAHPENDFCVKLLQLARTRYAELTGMRIGTKPANTPESPVAAAKPEAPVAPVATGTGWNGQILDGTYTVEFEDGTYRTLKVKTQGADATFKPGAQLISYLNGPDNWSNYQGFGEVKPGNVLHVWAKHQSATHIIAAATALLAGPEAMINGLQARGRRSGTCGICGRKLTTPESLDRGIGPECAGKLGM